MEDVGPGSDLYSLGMVLIELLTGELAFSAKTDAAWAHAHVYESPDWKNLTNQHGKAVVQFLRVAVEKQPNKRYLSAQAMLSALLQLPDDSAVQASGVLGRLVNGMTQGIGNAITQTRPTHQTGQAGTSRPVPGRG